MSDYARIIKDSPEISLLRYRHLDFVCEVIDRAFREQNAARIPYREMLMIIRDVSGEFSAVSNDPDEYRRPPEDYLRDWIGAGSGTEHGMWFMRSESDGGDWIRLHAHARRASEFVRSLNTPFRSFGTNAMHDLLRKIADGSALLNRNRERALQNAMIERERLDGIIDDLSSGGDISPISEDEADGIARGILRNISDVLLGVSEVPDMLRRVSRVNRELYNRSDRTLRENIQEANDNVRRAQAEANGYAFINEILNLHLDEDRSRDLDLSIRSILDRVGYRLSAADRRRLNGFMLELQTISRGIREEELYDLEQQLEYMNSSEFTRNQRDGLAARRAFDAMRRIKETVNPKTIQEKSLGFLGLVIDRPPSLLPASGFRLSDTIPSARSLRRKPRQIIAPAGDENVKRAVDAARSEARVDPDILQGYLSILLEKKHEIRLTDVLKFFPPTEGVSEIMSWLVVASTRCPSRYEIGGIFTYPIPGSDPVRQATLFDPVFTREGTPGEGMERAVLHAETHGIIIDHDTFLEANHA